MAKYLWLLFYIGATILFTNFLCESYNDFEGGQLAVVLMLIGTTISATFFLLIDIIFKTNKK